MAQAFFLVARDSETDQTNITCFVPGIGQNSCDNTHPNFETIRDAAQDAIDGIDIDESVLDLFDVAEAVSKHFEPLSERVSVKDGRVYFDGDEINNELTRQIVRFLEGGYDFVPLVRFLEKLFTNPSEHSREQLYSWLVDQNFTIADNGDVIAYKGVTSEFKSHNSGSGIVNGEQVNGRLDNTPGNNVEMPRSDVNHDPANGCSYGLHVGTHSFAKSFAGHGGFVVTVLINPRDVVSVPVDCSAQKMRVCRYHVLNVVEEEISEPLFEIDEPDYNDFEIWAISALEADPE